MATLEQLAGVRDGLRLFPERGKLIMRLEWSWLLIHPAREDREYLLEHPELDCAEGIFHFRPLEELLQPPFRWSKQPLTTSEECFEAITEVVCRLTNLDTLLWESPYLPMQSEVVDFLATKASPLKNFQIDLMPRESLIPGGYAWPGGANEHGTDVLPRRRFSRRASIVLEVCR